MLVLIKRPLFIDLLEPSVRCELMEQLPPVCMVIVELNAISDTVSGYILPIIVKYLTDSNNQVIKMYSLLCRCYNFSSNFKLLNP